MSASKFIVVTGCNGVGKSTVARALAEALPASLLRYSREFQRFREEASLDTEIRPRPRLLYYLAATVELSTVVDERLGHGHVVSDRYLESPISLVRAETNLTEAAVDELCRPFVPLLRRPDLTLLLTVGYATACGRIRQRRSTSGRLSRVQQRTLDSGEFFRRRQAAMRSETARLGPVVELDTTWMREPEVCAAAVELATRLASGIGEG